MRVTRSIGSGAAPSARIRRRTAVIALACAVSAAGGASARAAFAQSAPAARAIAVEVPVAPAAVPVDGAPRLVYELVLENLATQPLSLEAVDILDAEDGALVARVHGGDLDARLRLERSSPGAAESRVLGPGARGRVYLEWSPEAGPPPRLLEHRVTYRGVGEAAGRRASVRGARVAVRTEPPVVLSPPVRGGPWAAVYEPSWERGHRRVVYAVDGHARIPGRFAIDWIKLDAEGRYARGDEDEVAGWLGYGADVLAVADAVVVAVRDDVPESATLSGHPDHPLEDATGNYIALDLGGGRFAFYEHLKPGSIRVRAGDRVRRGAVIAAVGFTGHTTGPHLHFHVADAASPLGAEGVPFVLDRFRLLGRYDDFGAFGRAPWTPIDSAGSVRREEMPAPNVVVDFGGAAASTGPPDRTTT